MTRRALRRGTRLRPWMRRSIVEQFADLAKHVANAYATDGMDRGQALRRVYEGLQVEMRSPTDEPTGGIAS